MSSPPSHRAPRRSHRRVLWWALTVVVTAVVVLLGSVAVTGWLLGRHYDSNVTRLPDQFAGVQHRPADAPGTTGQAWLLVGSDSRTSAGHPQSWAPGAQRTDAIMLARIPADRGTMDVISIPRDSWVPIRGHDHAKINAAYSWGGMSLLIETVEQLTGVRVDHVAVIDFTGFSRLTDTLGGVTIRGQGPMDGAQALAYVRKRHGLPGGDFDRMGRQQAWMRAVIAGLNQDWSATDAPRLNRVLDTATRSVAVDDTVTGKDLRRLARSLHGMTARFQTAPVRGTGRSPDGKQAIVVLDKRKGAALWGSIR